MLQFRFVTDTNGYFTGHTGLLVFAITNPEIAAKNSKENIVFGVNYFYLIYYSFWRMSRFIRKVIKFLKTICECLKTLFSKETKVSQPMEIST